MFLQVIATDDADDAAHPGAVSAQLSAARPRPDHPEWDVVVWVDIATSPGTAGAVQFYDELERWVLSNCSGSYAMARPEWSKSWAYDVTGPFANPTVRDELIPATFLDGYPSDDNWDTAVRTLNALDPHGVF